MAASSKVDNNAFLASGSDIMRNAMQNRRVDPDVPYLIPILQSLPSASVVCEVGCGPGGITLDMAQRYPGVIVLGVDIDEHSIKQAKEAATAAGATNVRYIVGDAVSLSTLATTSGFEALDAGCDLVYSHAAVMHCGDQLETVKQMRMATKPGGKISMNEGDMGLFFAYPDIQGIKKFLEVFPRLGAAKGADPYLGRKLVSHAIAAGFARDDITEVSMTASMMSRQQQREGFAKAFEGIFAELTSKPEWMKASAITEEDITLILKGFEEWVKCEGGIMAFPSMVIICNKAQ